MSGRLAGAKRSRRAQSEQDAASPQYDVNFSGMQHLSLRIDDEADEYVDLFIKSAAPDDDSCKDLLVVSAPDSGISLNDEELEAAFSAFSDIKIVDKGTAGEDESALKYFLIRLASSKALRKVLGASSQFPQEDQEGRPLGLRSWLGHHEASKVDSRTLQATVDKYMAKFEAGESEVDRKKSELSARMQADGFTLVTRKTKIAAEDEENDDVMLSRNQKSKEKRGDLAVQDFYKFQRTENKFDKLTALRAQFAEDKERIKKLKDQRKFKPY